MRAYCTEDTPYNKSTATSLSDLSVIDDDDINLSNKSGSGMCRDLIDFIGMRFHVVI